MGALDNRRVVNAVLTDVARGYKHPEFIGTRIAPIVNSPKTKASYVEFGVEDFVLFSQLRARAARSNRLDIGNAVHELTILERDVEVPVPWEDNEEATVPVNPMMQAPRKAMRSLMLGLEHRIATLVMNPDNFAASNKVALAGNSQWDSGHSDSTPFADVATARAAIRSGIGMTPNTMAVGHTVYEALKQHPKVLERLSNNSDKIATTEILAALFEVDNFLVGKAVGKNLGDAASAPFVDVWGKSALLCYSPDQLDAVDGEPAFAFTFRREGYPVTDEYRESQSKTDVFRTTDKAEPKIVGQAAGYLLTSAIS